MGHFLTFIKDKFLKKKPFNKSKNEYVIILYYSPFEIFPKNKKSFHLDKTRTCKHHLEALGL